MKVRALITAAIMLLVTNTTALAQMNCTVNDPTGTPLNVRSKPNGSIVGALHNGTSVNLWKLIWVNDKPWARITPVGPGKSGWVFHDYLKCEPLYD
ncbi:MAG: SH3 domain-containing protein [Methyloceanibacter sp.]|nr:SH3 domain-containing protein [Methyloceanibacter sp.]